MNPAGESVTEARRFVALSVIAEVAGVSAYRLQTRFFPSHWGSPRDFYVDGTRLLVNVAALPELADQLGEGDEPAAAEKVRACWLRAAKAEARPAERPAAKRPEWYRGGQFE
jgi:hypothetical protein